MHQKPISYLLPIGHTSKDLSKKISSLSYSRNRTMIVVIMYAHCHHYLMTHQSRWTQTADRLPVPLLQLQLPHSPTLWTPLQANFGGIANTLFLTLRAQSLMVCPWQLQLATESPAPNLESNFNPSDRLMYWEREMWCERYRPRLL